MVKINRDYVLKTFLEKVREAKRLDMKEIKIPVKFLDDLAYIIMQLMSEELSKAYEAIENKPKEEVKTYIPVKRKVLKEITPRKLEELKKNAEVKPLEEKIVEEIQTIEPKQLEMAVPTEELKEKIEIPIIPKPVKMPVKEVIEEPEEDEEDEDDNTNVMYGGTW